MSRPDWLDEAPCDWIDPKNIPGAPQEVPEKKPEERSMVETMERRVISGAHLRAAVEDGQLTLTGHAATYGDLSRNMAKPGAKPWHERIAPGAFEKTLRSNPDILFTVNHDPNQLMGRTRSGTLALSSDSKGLRFRVSLPNTEAGRSLHESVLRGDLSDMSFAFTDPDDSWAEEDYEDEDDLTRSLKRGARVAVRTLRGCSVHDVSACTFGAYPKGPSVQARSMPVVLATCPDDIGYRPWLAEAQRRSDAIAKMIASESVPDDSETVRQRRRTLLNGCLS